MFRGGRGAAAKGLARRFLASPLAGAPAWSSHLTVLDLRGGVYKYVYIDDEDLWSDMITVAGFVKSDFDLEKRVDDGDRFVIESNLGGRYRMLDIENPGLRLGDVDVAKVAAMRRLLEDVLDYKVGIGIWGRQR